MVFRPYLIDDVIQHRRYVVFAQFRIISPKCLACSSVRRFLFGKSGPITSLADCSFDEDTLVATTDGDIPISELEVGDTVLAYNEETGEIGEYEVTAIHVHTDEEILNLVIDGELIVTTPDHPFYTADGEWVAAGELEIGDEIVTADDSTGTVEALHVVIQPQAMFNLTVDEAHTFFVGEGEWLVHNRCIRITKQSNPKKFTQHYNDHRRLLEKVLGKHYPKSKVDQGMGFINDLNAMVQDGRFTYYGLGTLQKGDSPVHIFRGQGLTLVVDLNGEWRTLLQSGTGKYLAIRPYP